jgi:hypothetical protein
MNDCKKAAMGNARGITTHFVDTDGSYATIWFQKGKKVFGSELRMDTEQ